MARKRMLSPSWAKHADLYDAEVSSGLPLRVAFAALWTVTDRRGVFAWSRNLKPDVLPYDACDMIAVLDALEVAGFVVKYEVDGKPYGFIPSFSAHQHFHRDEKPSKLPAPSEHGAVSVDAPHENDGSTATGGKTTTPNGRLATYGIRHTASDITDTPHTREKSIAEEALEAQCGEHYPAVVQFLDARPHDKRASWAADLLALIGPSTGTLPEDLARACTDGHLAEPPVTNARTLRIFVASCRNERKRGEVSPLPSAPRDGSGMAGQVFATIRSLVTEIPNPGRGIIRAIPKAKVAELGERALAAYEQIGGAERFLDQTEKVGFLLRDFTNAYNSTQKQSA